MLLPGYCRRCKKPLKPCVIVQIATEGNNGDVPRQIPVLGASVCGDNVLLVHGHTLKPTFENLVRSHTCLSNVTVVITADIETFKAGVEKELLF